MPDRDVDLSLRAIDVSAVFAGLASEHADVFWLDAGPDAAEGWSWLGFGTRVPESDVRRVRLDGDASSDEPEWVGWFDFDGGAAAAGVPAAGDEEARWLRVDALIAVDHRSGAATVRRGGQRVADDLRRWSATPVVVPSPRTGLVATARCSGDEYAARVERCRDAIRAGDAYQLCLTTRFDVAAAVDPVAAYLRLRTAARTTDGGFVRIGDVALVSASPEEFLRVEGGRVRTSPIKGTRPRGASAAEDAALAEDLATSVKERAENVMIVDLMRNDLSRICAPESVSVDRLLQVESYPDVHQLVSTVSGRLVSGTDVGSLLAAAFPAGSMTGAPKLSAMTILAGLEDGPRGIYAGCFGRVSRDGGLSLSMVIRSIVCHPDRAYVGAGGGITWRSDPSAEVEEAALKARGPLAAIGAILPADW